MSRKQIFEFVGRAQEENGIGRPKHRGSGAARNDGKRCGGEHRLDQVFGAHGFSPAQRIVKAPAFRFVFQCNETGGELQHGIGLRAERAGFERFAVRFRQKKLRRVSRKKRHQSHCVFIQTGNRFRVKKDRFYANPAEVGVSHG